MKILLTLLTLVLLLPSSVLADKASGTFIATQACDLYQSKRNRTNPGNLKATVGSRYPIREALLAGANPEWLRVLTEAEVGEKLRWIEASCGNSEDFSVVAGDGGGTSEDNPVACRTPNAYDSHVLAISWQPAFCEMHHKTECQSLDSNRYDASHFTLHGLWPNKQGCGIDYGFCGEVRHRPGDFCDYPTVNLTEPVHARLGVVMPSAKHGTCLQRHEWWKHGTCRDADPNVYYNLAMSLLDQINQSSFVTAFIRGNIGNTVDRAAVHQAFDAAFGDNAHQHMGLFCQNGMLQEIQLSLPKDFTACSKLSELLAISAPFQGGRCSEQIEIDVAGPS